MQPPELARVDAGPFLVLVETTGKFHLRYEIGGRSVDDGRCGIDDNWVRSPLSSLVDVDQTRLCRYCFPAPVGD